MTKALELLDGVEGKSGPSAIGKANKLKYAEVDVEKIVLVYDAALVSDELRSYLEGIARSHAADLKATRNWHADFDIQFY